LSARELSGAAGATLHSVLSLGRFVKTERFTAVVLSGHKGAAVEVLFDPAKRWGVPARRITPGRRGHAVRGTVNHAPFESFVVPRSRRFFLLLSSEVLHTTGAAVGDTVNVVLAPREGKA
jgi:hypothetical protein